MTGLIRSAVLAVCLALPLGASANPVTNPAANPATYKLLIYGLACPFCAYGVEKELIRTQGVRSIKIDIDAGTVTVIMAEGATLSEARAKRIVKDAGFTLARFEKLNGPGPTGKAGK